MAGASEDWPGVQGKRTGPEFSRALTEPGLVGRSAERSQIDALIADAGAGRSGTLVLVGEPGIGKTALLSYARQAAFPAQVVEASGHEATQGVPFGTLATLEASLRPFVPSLNDHDRLVLEVALNRRGETTPIQMSDRHAVGVALLRLLAAAATAEPLVVLIDDVHWVDPSSAGALAFASRRLVDDPVAILLAVRQVETSPLLDSAHQTILLGGLEEWQASALLGPGVAVGVAAQLARATGGNPLAMLNAAGSLSDEQRRGRRSIDAPVAVGSVLEEAFAARIAALSDSARLLMLVVAAEGPVESGVVTAAATELGIEAETALADATSSGFLLSVDSRVGFRHPLIRSAVYHGAGAAERQTVHRALARVLRRDDDLSRRAFHLAAVASGPDEAIASVVEAAASVASHRFAYAEAGAGYALAATLSPGRDDGLRRTVLAANAHYLAGATLDAVELIEGALASTADPLARADLLMAYLDLAVQTGRSYLNLTETMIEAANEVRDADPFRAAALLVSSALPAMAMGRTDLMEASAVQARQLVAGSPFAAVADVLLALSRLTAGHQSGALASLLEFGHATERADLVPETAMLVGSVAMALAWADQTVQAQAMLNGIVSRFRTSSMLANLTQLLTNRGWVCFYAGDWSAALADGEEALALAQETHQVTAADYALLMLATVEAGQGRPDARRHLEMATASFGRRGAHGIESWALGISGFLEQGAGHPEEAVRHLERAEALMAETGSLHPAILSTAPELVEAYVRMGDPVSATRWFTTATQRARQSENATAMAQALRCGGLLASPDDVDAAFGEALACHSRSPRPFERARTELCYGERLRRDKRPGEAVPYLEAAGATFSALGADPWLGRCDRELRACGVTTSHPVDASLRSLTAQELQVTLRVAGGATNREVAAALFLSPRTVESHLASVFRKLEVRTRAELAKRIALISGEARSGREE